jgi:hypothetical protein
MNGKTSVKSLRRIYYSSLTNQGAIGKGLRDQGMFQCHEELRAGRVRRRGYETPTIK